MQDYSERAAPPALKSPRFGQAVEHKIVRGLIRALRREGFKVHSIAIDHEDYVLTPNERAAVCEVFEYDAYVTLRFTRGDDDSELFGVLLVQGNGTDIISDYTCDHEGSVLDPPAGTFSHAMDKYLDHINERS